MARPIDIEKRIAALSPAMRDQLRRRLAGEGPSDSLSISIPRRPDKDVAPLSFAQERVWFLSCLEPESPVNNRPFALRCRGPLETGILERVLSKIIERHEILRATVCEKAGIPVQKIVPAWLVRLMEKDFSKILSPEKSEFVDAFVVAETRKPFDLAVGPLLRATLLRLDTQDHVLLVVVHHLLFDGWSAKVFAGEIETLYTDYVENKAPSLPDLPIQYADYAHWQRAAFDSGRIANHLTYWEKTLNNAPPELVLPKSCPKIGAQAWEGVRRSCLLSSALTASLRNLGNRDGATLFMVLLAAFNALLYRYSNQEDIVVGAPVAGRTASKSENLIGFFVNTLVLRNDLSGNPSFRQFLGRVKQTVLDAISHQEAPFEKVVSQLNPGRVLNRSPLFQVLFNFENFPRWAEQTGTPAWEEFEFDPGVAPFDIDMEISEKGGGLSCKLTLKRALFDADTVVRMLGHYETLLRGIVDDPDQCLSDLALLTVDERHQLLVTWNNTHTDTDETKFIHQMFETQAARKPDSVAVVFSGHSLTYRELDIRANRLSNYLIKLGILPDTRVAIGMERSIEMVVSLLAILKAGGAYVPLDPSYPPDRLAFMLEDSAPMALLTQSWLKDRWDHLPSGVPVIELDRDAGLWDECSSTAPDPGDLGLASYHLAYVIYTSGSTGTPKGVMNEHRAVVNRLAWMQSAYSLEGHDAVLQKTPFSFDVSVWEFFWPLAAGARLVVARPEGHKDPGYLTEVIGTEGITTLHFVPSMLHVFLEHPNSTSCSHLKRVVCSGEALPASLSQRFHERLPKVELYNLYGPTEAAVDVTAWTCLPGAEERSVPIGRPIANTRIYILDGRLQPVPVGVTGEIYIGGIQVARGYLNRPELTAERFLPDPFTGEPDARVFKTGDLGRWRPDGTIEFLGRNDFQVKIRGFRIELGEIEARLASIPGVGEAVVLAREDSPGEKRLVAYYTVKVAATKGLVAGVLRGQLAKHLPEYMLPWAYVALESFPLTPNGKTDRKALPAPEADACTASDWEAPVGEMEEALARIWLKLLNVKKVGRHDHFFEMGGHSLLAITLIEQLRHEGLNIDVRVVFTTPTLMEMAAAIGAAETSVKVPSNRIVPGCDRITPELLPLIALEQGDIDCIAESTPGGATNIQDIYPLAPLQEGILFHHLMDHQLDAYLLLSLMAFDSRDLLDSFLSAAQAVIDRHDILRTAILWEGLPEPVQVVWRSALLTVEQVSIDLSGGDAADQLRSRFNRGDFRIDIRKAPMMRAFIARDDTDGRWLLALTHHHLVTDHTTMEILGEEIRAHLAGEAYRLPVALTFRNFVAQARLGVTREEHEAFFRRMLKDVEEPTAPFGLLDVRGDGSDIAEARLPLDLRLSQRLRERARMLGVGAASVFHLAWARVLACVSGREDVVFGTVLFGRMQGGRGSDRVMGMFINTLPVRIGVKDEAVEQAVITIHRMLAELLYHEHAPLVLAQRCSSVPAQMPLFSSLLNYRHDPPESLNEDATAARRGMQLLYTEERTNYPLMLSVEDLGEGFALTAQVQTPIEPMRICRFMNTVLFHLADALEQAPNTAVESIEVLPEAERRQVLFDWNATKVNYPKGHCIHHVFEAQVTETPAAVAVQFKNEWLSYADLNQRANRLAHHLRSMGVKADVPVGICMNRSLEAYVGVLSILKAGGAYVPLDPAYPMERLIYMLSDSGADILLTTRGPAHYFPDFHGRIVFLDNGMEWGGVGSGENPTWKVDAENLAYLLYTSGSTGKPKGVAMGHGPLSNLISWQIRDSGFAKEARTLQFASLCFDVSFQEMFATWCTGGTLMGIADHIRRDSQALVTFLEREKVHRLFLPFIVLQALAETAGHLRLFPSSLREVITAGEPLHITPAILQFFSNLGHCTLQNQYGPTESHVVSSFTLQGTARDWPQSPPIGRPIHNTKLYVLDRQLRPVPIGVAGELHIGGTPLAKGYLHKPEQTEERFIPDPFSGRPGFKMYRTGDRVRYLADGNLEFLGRMDNQVKLRGYRVELGEIESVLGQHPGIRQCVVVARERAPGDRCLAGFVVPHKKMNIDPIDLRRFLRYRLPEFMIPSIFTALESLPVLPNGKADRRALLSMIGTELHTEKAYAAPQTAMESILSEVWASILNIKRIGIHDNFFESGGHSLMATRIVARLLHDYRMVIPLRALFEHPTIFSLARHIEQLETASGRIWTPRGLPPDQREEFVF